MAKPNKPSKNTPQPQAQAPSVKFQVCPLFRATAADKLTPAVNKKFLEFLNTKKENKMAPYGASDKACASAGHFHRMIPGIRHAHLTHDLSIFYSLHGSNPTIIRLYGFFTHDESGTGQPPGIRVQQSLSKKFQSQDFQDMT